MKKTSLKILGFFSLSLLFAQAATAQVKIGDNPTTINGGSVLELQSTDKGLLHSRVSLSSTTDWGLSGTPVAGMMVYNSNTSIGAGSAAYPTIKGGKGVYYWDGTGWVAIKFEAGSSFEYGDGAPTGSCSGDVIYVDTTEGSPTEGQTWTCNGSTWIAYTTKNSTEWMYTGQTTDAGGDKVARIWRKGYIGISPTYTPFKPGAPLHVLNDGQPGYNQDNIVIESYGASSMSPRYYGFVGTGTYAAPGYLSDNQELVALAGRPKIPNPDGQPQAMLSFAADGNHSATSSPTKMNFYTTATGTNTTSVRATLKNNGYLGLNTEEPQAHLHIQSNADNTSRGTFGNNGIIFLGNKDGARLMIDQNEIMTLASNTAATSLLLNGPPQDNTADGTSSFSSGNVAIGYNHLSDAYVFVVESANNLAHAQGDMRVNNNLLVGSGTPGTHALLDVNGSNAYNLAGGAWFSATHAGGSLASYSTSSQALSIWASNRIAATHFLAYSDRRIKKDIQTVSGIESIDFINKINIVDYKYKDVVDKGDQNQKGVIAQEVEAIAPEAITTMKGVIPNVYLVSTKAIENTTAKTLTVTVEKTTDFKVGDNVKLLSFDQDKMYEVVAINGDNTFTVKDWNEKLRDNSVFVYGKEVNDYKSVNYDYLYSANIAATQELYKMIVKLQSENASLKAEVSDIQKMKTELNELKAAVETIVPVKGTLSNK